MNKTLSLEDLRTLCGVYLEIDYDSIGGETKPDKIRELLLYINKSDRERDLVDALKEMKSTVAWETVLDQPEMEFADVSPGTDPTWSSNSWLIGAGVGLLVIIAAVVAFQMFGGDDPPDEGEPAAVAALPSATQAPTNTPTNTSEPTPIPSATPPPRPVIAPVAEGEQMVVVAALAPQGGATPRQVSDEIVEDLTQKLETEGPFLNVGIRHYSEVVASSEQALAIAEEAGAAVVIWGSYTDDVVELNIQVGSLASFPDVKFEREVLESWTNVQVELTDIETQSVASEVLTILSVLYGGAEQVFDTSLVLANYQLLEINSGEFVGASSAVKFHSAYKAFLQSNFEQAISDLNEIIDLDLEPNPIAFTSRGLAHMQLNQFDAARRDFESARRLPPEDWSSPSQALAFLSLITREDSVAVDLEQIVNSHPQDWYVYYIRGLTALADEDYTAAKADFDKAITLEPDLNWPYIFAIQIALREGNVIRVQELGNTVIKEFPNANLGNRVLTAILGDDTTIGHAIAATSQILIGQFGAALPEIEAAVAIEEQFPDELKTADVYWTLGFVQCNLNNLEAAEEAYSRSIEIDPAFTLAYFSRATVRLQQGNTDGAEADFQYIEENAANSFFAFGLESAKSGSSDCKTFIGT